MDLDTTDSESMVLEPLILGNHGPAGLGWDPHDLHSMDMDTMDLDTIKT